MLGVYVWVSVRGSDRHRVCVSVRGSARVLAGGAGAARLPGPKNRSGARAINRAKTYPAKIVLNGHARTLYTHVADK